VITGNRGFAVRSAIGALLSIFGVAYAQQPVTYSVPSYDKGETAYAYSDKINVRETPDTGANVLAQLMTGDTAAIVEKTSVQQTLYGVSDYWYKIDCRGQEGYVWGGLLAKSVGVADLEGKGSSDRILMQVLRSYQDAVPTQLNEAVFKDTVLPKLSADQRDFVLHHYFHIPGGDDATIYLTPLNDSGDPFIGFEGPLSKAEILVAEEALKGVSMPNTYSQEFGVSGKISLKACSGGKSLWELAYPVPRLSASTAAENLFGMQDLGIPDNPDERFSEDFNFNMINIDVLADKGFSPPVVLLSISVPAGFDEGWLDQAALYQIDAKGPTLVTTYLAGSKAGGEGEWIEFVFPSDKGGQKNVLTLMSKNDQESSVLGRLGWNGALFSRLP
jgi:hypothetical protein